ncbi:cation transporter [Parapedobacter defluvii]|uniref:Cation transporter n=1 Tax=Parapedobacter defluvii TaxID=2045106 RepID=A0ABQ1LMG0_9SPHI|nr:TolC family protein [Parapedobacter defluvii]RQP15295.1 MAG: TolC family protein [Parapedobacter sp.]GGC25488.1 cation transporter [Parapedobacter defluvii]
MKMGFRYLAVVAFCCVATGTHGQYAPDTLAVTPTEAEAVFLQRNLRLLAGKLDIDMAKAQVIQAKLWPNPVLSIGEVNPWSNRDAEVLGRLFGDWGNHAQVAVDVEQLIQTAGKRRKRIAVEEAGLVVAEHSFEDLLRSLQAEFRTEMAELYRTQAGMVVYQGVLGQLQQLLGGYQRQVAQGNISRSEYMRLQASEVALMKAIDDLRRENGEAQRQLKTLMGLTPQQELILTGGGGGTDIPIDVLNALDAPTLQEWANTHNAELAALQSGTVQADWQLRYEQAQRVPDVTVSAGYDRGGNIMRDFVGLGIAVDLPFFNRNQGNIKAAQLALAQSRLLADDKKNEAESEAIRIWKDLLAIIARREHMGTQYEADMDTLLASYHRNFAERHISLLEYLDFLEAYLHSKDTLLDTEKELRVQYEALRYHVGNQLP